MSNNLFFGKTWQVTTSRNGLPILNYSSDDTDSNRIIFDCAPYNGIGQASQLKLSIYNPSAQDVTNVLLNDIVQISAGYTQRGAGIIFYGQIQSFYGAYVTDGNDPCYVFYIYASIYFGGNQGVLSPQLNPATLDLSVANLGAPLTIGSQAAYIANYYNYKAGAGIQQTYALTPSTSIVVTGSNMDEVLADFFRQTGAALIFDSRDFTYGLIPATTSNADFNTLSVGKSVLRIIDNNNGLVGFPTYDVITGYVKVTMLIDSEVDFLSLVQIDLSNSQVSSIDKSLNQDILVSVRNYKNFLVNFISYYGDTRSNEWYQTVLAFGQY